MYDKLKLRDILLQSDCRTLDDVGYPFPPKADVYKLISSKMKNDGSDISAKHVYVIVRENRNGYTDLIKKAFSIKTNDARRSQCHSTLNSTNATENSISHSEHFDLFVSAEKWREMKPTCKIYCGRSYQVLQSGWTDILAERLWQQDKLNCVISFKNITFTLVRQQVVLCLS